MQPTYDDLLDENRALKAQIAELRFVPEADVLRTALRITPKQAQLLLFIADRDLATKTAIYAGVFQHDDGDGPIDQIVNVTICHLRRRAREQGWPGRIENIWGTGYRMDADQKAFVHGIARPQPERLAA